MILAIIFGALVLFVFVSKVQEKHYKTETSLRIDTIFREELNRMSIWEMSAAYSEAFNRPAPWPLRLCWRIMGVR